MGVAIKRALGMLESPPELRTTLIATGFDELAITVDHASIAAGSRAITTTRSTGCSSPRPWSRS